MEKQVLTEKQIIWRTHLFWAPLVIFSLLTCLFTWAGGGKGIPSVATAEGILKTLPGALVKPVTHLDKMGYYDWAKRDSQTTRQRLTIQQNYARQLGIPDSSVTRIRQKLEVLKAAIKPETGAHATSIKPQPQKLPTSIITTKAPDLTRFEQTIHRLQHPDKNPEIDELNGVVEKLITLQRSQRDTAQKTTHTLLPPPPTRSTLPITALPDPIDTIVPFDSATIEATIPEETVLVSGSELKLQLVTTIKVGKQTIPAGAPIFGTASLTGERLHVTITAIAAEGHILPVNLEVQDEDGIAGIYIPGAPLSEALRESTNQQLGAIDPGLLTTTLSGQAIGAGANLARSLIGKKIRPVKLTIPAGYHVLLHQKNAAQ